MLSYTNMTTLLDKALRQVKSLPAKRQDDYGAFLLTMLEQDTSDLRISDDQAREVRRRLNSTEPMISEIEAMEFFSTLV